MIDNDLDKAYRFCPKCGKSLQHKKTNLFVCDSCSHKLYINPVPCNALIITNSKGQILLVKRAFEPAKDKWDLPGGFVDIGDNFESSVVREIKEELDIIIKESDVKYFKSYAGRYLFSDINYYTLGMVFIVKVPDSVLVKMKALDDVASYKFFDIKNIDWENIGFKVIVQALKDYIESTI